MDDGIMQMHSLLTAKEWSMRLLMHTIDLTFDPHELSI